MHRPSFVTVTRTVFPFIIIADFTYVLLIGVLIGCWSCGVGIEFLRIVVFSTTKSEMILFEISIIAVVMVISDWCRFVYVTVSSLLSRVSFRLYHLPWCFGRCFCCCVDKFTSERFEVWDPGIWVSKILIFVCFCPILIIIKVREDTHIVVKTNQQSECEMITQQQSYSEGSSAKPYLHVSPHSKACYSDFFGLDLKTETMIKNIWNQDKDKVKVFRMTMVQNVWYQIVKSSELLLKAMGFVIRCAIWWFYKEKIAPHNFRIRRLITKEENNRSNHLLASKASRKASSNSLLCLYQFQYMVHISAYVIICFPVVCNDFVNSV